MAAFPMKTPTVCKQKADLELLGFTPLWTRDVMSLGCKPVQNIHYGSLNTTVKCLSLLFDAAIVVESVQTLEGCRKRRGNWLIQVTSPVTLLLWCKIKNYWTIQQLDMCDSCSSKLKLSK